MGVVLLQSAPPARYTNSSRLEGAMHSSLTARYAATSNAAAITNLSKIMVDTAAMMLFLFP
jgi:hypothetical protein